MIRILIITVMVVLLGESIADDYHGWEYVKKDTMIPHDLESYPLHLKTVSKIQDGDSITVFIDILNDIFLTLYFTPLDVKIKLYFFNLNLCASRNGDDYVNTTIDGDFITNTTKNIWMIRKTNISLELDFNSITLFRYNFSKIEEGCISLRSINVLWVYFASYLSSGFDELQYKPHNRDNSDCQVKEVGNPPYLKLACEYDKSTWFRCPFDHNFYKVFRTTDHGCLETSFDFVCPRDTHFYQACGHGDCSGYKVLKNSTLFCSTFVCDLRNTSLFYQIPQAGKINEAEISCNGKYECLNTQVDEQLDCWFDEDDQYQCKDNSSERTRKKVAASKTCDNKCDCFDCDDEAHCNSFHYGIECELHEDNSWGYYDGGSYAAPHFICDGIEHCTDGSDEKNCSQSNKTCQNWRGDILHLKDNQICAVPLSSVVCSDGKDQVNCSDPHKIAMSCLLAGFPTNISIFAVCKDYPLCDDDYNNNCLEPEGGCSVHKSFLCDGIVDCPGGSDESSVYCSHMSSFNCTRRVARLEAKGNKIVHTFPLSWANDNEMDCMDGKDEDDTYWNVCEFGSIKVFIEKESRCMDVKKCKRQEEGFISLKNLCDRVESCGGENDLCGVSRGIQTTWNTLIEHKAADTKVVSYCLKGLLNLQRSASLCIVIGVPSPNAGDTAQFVRKGGKLNLPNSKFDCRFVYGEMYVYLACSNSCLASSTPCPLRTIPSDTCVNKLNERVFTVTESNNLTVSLRKQREYHNEIYPCDNKNCVLYNEVCNLVDDCGDGSDEVNCTNHFYCPGHKEYIPLTSKCDGQVDCRDFYDECNHDCVTTQRYIFGNNVLRGLSWTVGILAILFNGFNVVHSILEAKTRETFGGLMNKCFIILISLGDFMMGIYLVVIACVDQRFGGKYCESKYIWMSSHWCSILGILSTFATQISLFSMTGLSLFRIWTVGDMIQRDRSSAKSKLQLILTISTISFLSAALAYIPVLTQLEDFFVNGLYYHDNPLFTASVSKDIHGQIFRSNYGYMKDTDMSWKLIRSIVRDMFTSEYEGIEGKAIHFYGNDGVCIFKYLVTKDDPQKWYSLTILAINFICFVIISVCYIVITARVVRSSNITSRNDNTQHTRDIQLKISAIIFTDFMCWIPLTVVCFLHYGDIINATKWYPYFSIALLPINSVINPLLYNGDLAKMLIGPARVLNRYRQETMARWTTRRRTVQDASRDNNETLSQPRPV